MAQISASEYNTREQVNILSSAIDKINAATEKNVQSIIASQQKSSDQINDSNKKANEEQIKASEKSAKEIEDLRSKKQEERDKKTRETVSAIAEDLNKMGSSITSQFRQMLVEYTNQQQRLSFNLIGSGMSYDTVRNALSVLGSNAFVKQNEVYSKLTDLVSSGITMNAAQRAFLQTASDQVSLGFDATSTSLNRLIQLQQADLSEARMAQMAGLRTFLEQNYQNSQYIKQGFSQVSDALVEMQSLMNAEVAMSTEKTIQTYLGSFQSAGGGKVSNIATALGQIGSGNFNLDDGMQNLMVMAASRAGLSYADLLTGGLDANSSERLMQALFGYVANMGSSGNNVATNALARMFGLDVSDIRAARQMGNVSTNYDTSIGTFFSNLERSTNYSTQLANWWNNGLSDQALTSNMGLVGFDMLTGLANLVGGALTSAGEAKGGLSGGFISLLGSGVQNAPAIGILANILTKKDVNGNSALSNLFSLDTLKNIASGGIGGFAESLITSMLGTTNGGTTNDAYMALAGLDGSTSFTSTGTFTGGRSGSSTSGRIANYERDTTSVSITNEEEPESHTLDDLYSLLADDFPTTEFFTNARVLEGEGTVLIGSAGTTQYITDMLTLTAVSAENILMLLENYFANGERTLIDMSALNLTNMYGDWAGTPADNTTA